MRLGKPRFRSQVEKLVKGDSIENAMPEIRLFLMCEAMKWTHLPVAGGLYDQHPLLLERWQYIFAARGEQQLKEQREQERQRNKPARGGRRPAGMRR